MEFNHKSTPNNNNQQKPPTTFLSQPSSRIFRVSRASGGKDRHSKVLTSKGLRDRRVRLSVSTAIQFYDLQDRLGFDQPSKAIEWLIRASSSAISQLPSLVSSFPEFPEIEPASSSTSETSKGSVLSLSRSEIRVKARERARIRAAKDKEDHLLQHVNQSSFTELLSEAAQIQEILRPTSFCSTKGQIFSTSSSSLAMMNYNMGSAGGDHAVMQQFSLGNDHIDCSQNFSFVPGLACFQRGTLQSNPPFSPTCSSLDGQNLPFVFGSVASSAEAQFSSIFDSRTKEPITPFCLDGYRPLDLKGKKKN